MSTPNVTEVRSVQLLQQVPPAEGLMIVSQVLRSLFRVIASLPHVKENPRHICPLKHEKIKSSFSASPEAKHYVAISITRHKKLEPLLTFVYIADALNRNQTPTTSWKELRIAKFRLLLTFSLLVARILAVPSIPQST